MVMSRVLHVLTSDDIIARPNFLTVAESLLETLGSRGALHLRSRALSGHTYVEIAERLVRVGRNAGAAVIVNERLDIAMAAGADGVQLGHGAVQATDVRRIASGMQVGVSVHSAAEAQQIGTDADWLIAGAIYPTRSHPREAGRGLDFVREVVTAAAVTVIAVGGVKPEYVASILRAGAAGVAVISGIWDEKDPNDALTHYLLEI